jgi:hypothetical protein
VTKKSRALQRITRYQFSFLKWLCQLERTKIIIPIEKVLRLCFMKSKE